MRRREFFGLALLFMVTAPSVAFSSDLRVLSGSGVQPAMNEIIPQFERTSGHRVSIVYDTVGEMADRVQKGELGERVERRLAAKLAADVAEYSRLMGADLEGTLARLKAIVGYRA